MVKTTVYLDPEAYRQLKTIARARRQAPAALVREAVAAYASAHGATPKPRSIGAFRSGRRNLGQSAEALLHGMGETDQ